MNELWYNAMNEIGLTFLHSPTRQKQSYLLWDDNAECFGQFEGGLGELVDILTKYWNLLELPELLESSRKYCSGIGESTHLNNYVS